VIRKDKNGIELKVGNVVKIENGYFKNDNGLFRIAHAPFNEGWNGNDYSLRKVLKNFSDSKSKHNISFYPLMVTVNNSATRFEAKRHNEQFATIEVVGKVKMYKVKQTYDNYYRDRETNSILYLTEQELEELKKEERVKFEILEVID